MALITVSGTPLNPKPPDNKVILDPIPSMASSVVETTLVLGLVVERHLMKKAVLLVADVFISDNILNK